jgi:MFS family permease
VATGETEARTGTATRVTATVQQADAAPSPRDRGPFGVHWDIVLLAAATFLLMLGQHLWFQFVPRYLETLGASILLVGLWGSLSDLLDASWQYPGGWITDHWGRRAALLGLTLISLVGLVLILVPDVAIVLVGLALYLALKAYAQPATFAVIGAALPRDRRAMGFVVQSMVHRLPAVIAPPLAGYWISTRFGVVRGVQVGVGIAIALTIVAFWAQARYYRPPAEAAPSTSAGRTSLPADLRRLLVSDILIRMGESATRVFIVLYVVQILGYSDFVFGLLIAVQVTVSMLTYVPAARRADRGRRKPWVALTFLFFTLFPLAIIASVHWALLVLAFVIGGLKEIGEPARKATIVDWSDAGGRGRLVGTYYAIRGFAITPVALVAGLLWELNPWVPFVVGALLSALGLAWYWVRVPNE